MIRPSLFLFLLASSAALAQQPAIPPELENPRITGVNKEAAHATLTPFPAEAAALRGGAGDAVFTKSLNGPWRFHWVKQPSESKAPWDCYKLVQATPAAEAWRPLADGHCYYVKA